MHVNISVTVKTVGGISLCDGGQLEESEGHDYFFVVFCARIEIDRLLCVICWVINHSLSVSCKQINHLRSTLVIWIYFTTDLQSVKLLLNKSHRWIYADNLWPRAVLWMGECSRKKCWFPQYTMRAARFSFFRDSKYYRIFFFFFFFSFIFYDLKAR